MKGINMTHVWNSWMERRGFMRTLGVLGGSVVAAQVSNLGGTSVLSSATSTGSSTAPAISAKIGLLVPRSGMFPGLKDKLFTGMKLGVEAFQARGGDARIQWVVQETSVAPGDMVLAAQRMVEKERVDLVLSFASNSAVQRLIPVFEESGTLLLALGAGENLVRPAERSPHVFYNTLGYWQGCYATGQRLVREHGRRVFILASTYETGHDALAAFRLGMTRAGGEEAGLAIVDAHTPVASLVKILGQLEEIAPDAVFLMQSGPDADSILSRGGLFGLLDQAPTAGSPFLVEGTFSGEAAKHAKGIQTCSSWAHGLENEENQGFVKSYRERTGTGSDAISLLGYDTANLLIAALGVAESRRSELRQALETAAWSSPRGELSMNATTHTVNLPLYFRTTRAGDRGLRTDSLGSVTSLNESSPEVQSLLKGPRVGWTNAYLSV